MPSGLRYLFRGSSLATAIGVLWRAKQGSLIGPITGDATSGTLTTKVFLRIDGAHGTTVGPVDSNAFRDGFGAIAINATNDLTLMLKRVASPSISAGFHGVRITGVCDNLTITGTGKITGFDIGIAKNAATLTHTSIQNIVSKGGGLPANTTGSNLTGGDYTAIGTTDFV
jgi:hypothetical protein